MTLLTDIPPAKFQAIVHNLGPQDHASLRQVSHCVSSSTNQHISFISLLLTGSSSEQQLCQWEQATQQLQHVAGIHVHIAGEVSAQTFDLTMQLLSQRHQIKELHLLPARLCGSGGSVPTLKAVAQLSSQLHTLVVDGIAVGSLLADLRQLAAAAGGWKLQMLMLRTTEPDKLFWLGYLSALRRFVEAAPGLKTLNLRIPLLVYDLARERSNKFVNRTYMPVLHATTAVAALVNTVMRLESLGVLTVDGVPDMWQYDRQPGADFSDELYEATMPAAEHTAADLIAFLQGKRGDGGPLQTPLAATDAFATLDDCGSWLLQQHQRLCDVKMRTKNTGFHVSWKQQAPHDSHKSSSLSSDATVAARPPVDTILWSVNAASFSSWDHKDLNFFMGPSSHPWLYYLSRLWGLYSSKPFSDLMQHVVSCYLSLFQTDVGHLAQVLADLKCLRHLQVSVSMTHHRKVDDDLKVWPETVAAAIAAVATVPGLKTLGVHAQYGLWAPEDLLLPLTAAGSSLEKLDLSGCLYKSMPPAATGASERMQWTGKREDEPPALATLVQRVRDLQTGPDSLPDVIITSLVQNSWSSHQHRNRSRRVLLEPLIHDLTQVMKATCLTTPCSSNSSSTVTNSNIPQQQPESSSDLELSAATLCWASTQMLATAATCVGSGWHYRLQWFTGLRELHINTTRCGYLNIFVECLPASLRVLSGGMLRITSFTDVIAAAASTDSTMPSCSKSTETPTRSQLQLEELRLSTSLLSSPSILASSRLYRLSIAGVLWSGGWAAAAAAWPNVQSLRWGHYSSMQSSNHPFGKKEPLDGHALLQGISKGFKRLRVLDLPELPAACYSTDVLQPVVELLKGVQHLDIGILSKIKRQNKPAPAYCVPAGELRAIRKRLGYYHSGTEDDRDSDSSDNDSIRCAA